MKSFTFACLAAFVTALPKPQGHSSMPAMDHGSHGAAPKSDDKPAESRPWAPFKIEDLPSTFKQPGAKRARVWIGPLVLQPAGAKRSTAGKMDPNSDAFIGPVSGLPSGLVLATNSSLRYVDGGIADVVNGVYNHHLLFSDTTKSRESVIKCPPGQGFAVPNMGLLMGASEANRDLQFSVPNTDVLTGFMLGAKDTVIMNGEIVNYSNVTKEIYAVSDIEYLETVPTGALDASMQVFQIDNCLAKPNAWPTNENKYTIDSGKAMIANDGYVMYRRGHMHDGGVNVAFRLNGKLICDSKAIYGGEDQTTIIDGKKWATISRMEACSTPVKVVKGDVIDFSATFDLDTYPARKHSHGSGMGENMGLTTFIFAKTPVMS